MSILEINDVVRVQMREIITRASVNPYTQAQIEALMRLGSASGTAADPAERNKLFTMTVPHGFNVTYTHEHQPFGLARHLSVSVLRKGRVPNVPAMEMIMQEFGFTSDFQLCINNGTVWNEKIPNGNYAINVIEPVEGWGAV
jgi:hypothetical protein